MVTATTSSVDLIGGLFSRDSVFSRPGATYYVFFKYLYYIYCQNLESILTKIIPYNNFNFFLTGIFNYQLQHVRSHASLMSQYGIVEV